MNQGSYWNLISTIKTIFHNKVQFLNKLIFRDSKPLVSRWRDGLRIHDNDVVGSDPETSLSVQSTLVLLTHSFAKFDSQA